VKVRFTESARADLQQIGMYIARDNPRRSVTFVRELLARCHALADMPRAFPLVPRYEHTGVRRRRHGEYLIFYHASADTVDILHVLNGAMDYEAILFPEE
jgi:plasmid stabilization system protein ParE